MEAIAAEDIAAIDRVVKSDPHLLLDLHNEQSPLFEAIRTLKMDSTRALLKHFHNPAIRKVLCNNPHAPDFPLGEPMYYGATKLPTLNSAEMITLLHENGFDLNMIVDLSSRPLNASLVYAALQHHRFGQGR